MFEELKDKYVIVRGRPGVYAGVFVEASDKVAGVVTLKDTRCLWRWEGAFSLNEVSKRGVGPESWLTEPVNKMYLTEVYQIFPCEEEAERNLRGHPVFNPAAPRGR